MSPDSTAALFSGTGAMGPLSGSQASGQISGSHALGQLSGTDAGAFALAAPALGPVLLKLALGLGAVILLILVLQKFARRFGGGIPRRGDPIQLLAQRPLGPRLSLAVVEVMDRTFLVGVSPHGIAKVADLTSARARQSAERAPGAEADGRNPGPSTQAPRLDGAHGFAGAGWKERLVRSLARVLSGAAATAHSEPASTQSELTFMESEPTFIESEPTSTGSEPASTSGEAGFEMEFLRRLEEIQARYPQVSEIGQQARRGAR